MIQDQVVRAAEPFALGEHYYPKVLNAHIHPLVRSFLSLGNERITERYAHLHPEVDRTAVQHALTVPTRHFRWAGCDLLHATTERGVRRMVVVETNSSPSGQKSMPRVEEDREQAGYRTLIEDTFLPMLRRRALPPGGLAVLYDKNPMEATGYGAALAQAAGETVWMVPFFDEDPDPPARFTAGGVLEIRLPDGEWTSIRAAFRYVTQRPWNRIPAICRTALLNPVLACLAGGRNKLLAAKAYDLYNADLQGTGLQVRTPETIWDVSKDEVPIWVARMGGCAVIKVPYSNAGQGVFTVTSPEELASFMAEDYPYDRFIVQALVGNVGWSSRGRDGRLYHVGTVPNRQNEIHVADLRFMVGVRPGGFYPVALYARRARAALTAERPAPGGSWDQLGTNLSVKEADGGWSSETDRLLLVDSREFNSLGLGLDELIEGYVQTVLSVRAIDRMCEQLINSKGRFRRRLFRSLNPDPALCDELMPE
jgi:hypothetical protein